MNRMGRSTALTLAIATLVGCAQIVPTHELPRVALGDPSFHPTVEANTRAPSRRRSR